MSEDKRLLETIYRIRIDCAIERIEHHRSMGLTWRDLEKYYGVDKAVLYRLYSRETQDPRISTLLNILRAPYQPRLI